jgi:sugar phosphate isomerase/epimerase
MKVALAVAPHGASPSAFVVFRDRLERVVGKAARMGYDGIELALGRADEVDPRQIVSLLTEYAMGISAVSTGRVFAEQEVWLTSPDERIRVAAVEILTDLVDLAAQLGAGRVNIGRVRGPIHPGETFEVTDARFRAGLEAVAGRALAKGIDIVIEPVNRYEINFVNSVDPDGLRLMDRVGLTNVKLMPDVFHMNIEDASIAASLIAAGSQVGYVHLADSNRWAPGRGHIDFVAVFGALRTIGYDGWVAVEVLPIPTADQAAQEAITYLRGLIPTGVL